MEKIQEFFLGQENCIMKVLRDIIQICNRILDSMLLEGYKDEREGIQMINNFIELGQETLRRDMGLVSIGD